MANNKPKPKPEDSSQPRNFPWPIVGPVIAALSLLFTVYIIVSNTSYFSGGRDVQIQQLKDDGKALRDTLESLRKELGDLRKDIGGQLSTLSGSISEMRGRLDTLDDLFIKPLKKVANSRGIPYPQFRTIGLYSSSPPQTITNPKGDPQYNIEIQVTEVGKDYVKFVLNGALGSLRFEHSPVTLSPVDIGRPVNLTAMFGDLTPVFGFEGIYLVVVGFPAKETAIIATGPGTPGQQAVS